MTGRVFFFADDGVHGEELWRSDGSRAGTALVKDIAPHKGDYSGTNSSAARVVGDTLFFTARDGSTAGSCGSRTVTPLARFWSRTSTRPTTRG